MNIKVYTDQIENSDLHDADSIIIYYNNIINCLHVDLTIICVSLDYIKACVAYIRPHTQMQFKVHSLHYSNQ